jgi:hypothetical protein
MQGIFIMVAIEYRRKRLQNNAFLRDKKSPMKMNFGFLMYTGDPSLGDFIPTAVPPAGSLGIEGVHNIGKMCSISYSRRTNAVPQAGTDMPTF